MYVAVIVVYPALIEGQKESRKIKPLNFSLAERLHTLGSVSLKIKGGRTVQWRKR